MNGSLLDTSVVIKYFHQEKTVAECIDNIQKDQINLSVIVQGELYYGASKSKRKQENREILSNFFNKFNTIPITTPITDIYGEIKHKLKSNGINIPENDLWIAATAVCHNLELITTDKHFAEIEGLRLKKL